MANGPTALLLALACLFAISMALPSIFNQLVPARTDPNVPRMLLGKPYRQHSGCNSQGCPRSCWTLAVTDQDGSDADSESATVPGPDHASTKQAPASISGRTPTRTHTEARVQLPLPLVLNTFPEFVPARLRLMKWKRPLGYNSFSDDARSSSQTSSDKIMSRAEDAQHVQLPVISLPNSKTEPHDTSIRIGRLKRLYDRGEWKSRLSEY